MLSKVIFYYGILEKVSLLAVEVMFFWGKFAGLTKAAKEEHARDLPLMNGIKEIIKSVGVLDSGSPDSREALNNLSSRLKLLQVSSVCF